MNVSDAAHATVRCYPGGSESLAPRIGMSPAVLRGKVNPNNERNILSLAEADEIMGVTGDHRILHALAADHGYTLQPTGGSDDRGDTLQSILSASAARGEFDRVLQDALADNLVTANELRLINEAGASHQAAYIALLTRLRAVSEGRAQA